MTSASGDSLVGSVLAERYRVVRKLGEGGMGVVYEAQHVLIERRLAVKLLHPEYARDAATVTRFRREALATARIGNEHIVESVDMGTLPDGSVFIVLEFLDGQEFEKVIVNEGPLPLSRVARIGTQLCEGLEAAHRAGIVHRDLKPANIYLVRRGQTADFVKILDFGISKFQETDGAPLNMTKSGATIGTPYYMPPEQVEGRKDIDLRADIYALGVILFRALTGEHPISADSFGMLMVKIVTELPPDVRKLRPDVPPEVAELIARMLAKDRHARPADCTEVRHSLARWENATTPDTGIAHDATMAAGPYPRSAGDLVNPVTGDLRPVDTVLPAPVAASPTGVPEAKRNEPVSSGAAQISTVTPVERPAATTAAPTNRGMFVGLAMGAVLVLAGAGGAAMMIRGGNRPSDAPRATVSPAPEPAASNRPAVSTAGAVAGGVVPVPAPEATGTVHIAIHTTPADATLTLDNAPLSNPFDGSIPRSGRALRLEARRSGFGTVLMDLVPTFDQNLTIPLPRGSGIIDRRVARTASTGSVAAHAPTTPEHPPANAATPAPRETADAPAQVRAPAVAVTTHAEPEPPPARPPAPANPETPPAHPVGPPPAPVIRDPI